MLVVIVLQVFVDCVIGIVGCEVLECVLGIYSIDGYLLYIGMLQMLYGYVFDVVMYWYKCMLILELEFVVYLVDGVFVLMYLLVCMFVVSL